MKEAINILEAHKSALKVRLWWAEEHDMEPDFLKEIPILEGKLESVVKALKVLSEVKVESSKALQYFYHQDGHVIQKGDEYLGVDGVWRKARLSVGQRYNSEHFKAHRRLVS